MVNYDFDIKLKVHNKIHSFYMNLYKFKRDRYSYVEILKLIDKNKTNIFRITKYSLLMNPYLHRWVGLKRILIDNWNFAIIVNGNQIKIVDACHKQNMTNNPEIQETYAKPYSNPRISNIQFPTRLPDNPYFIRAKIDGDWQGIRKITREEHERGQIDLEFAVKLAEKCYNKELNEKRFDIDEFVKQGRKP